MIRTLLAHGIEPDVIVGTSIGAVVGGCQAAGRLDVIEEWARGLTRRGILGYLDISLTGGGLIGGGKLAARLEEKLGNTPIEALPIRFATITTEVGTGHEIWLTRGRLVDAMRAYALPGIFPPVVSTAAGWSTARWSIRCRCRPRARSARGSSSRSISTPIFWAAASPSAATASSKRRRPRRAACVRYSGPSMRLSGNSSVAPAARAFRP